MSRLFDGTDDEVQWNIGGCNLTGAYSQVQVVKLDAGVVWQSFLGNEITASGSEIAIGRHGGTGLLLTSYAGGAGGTPNAIAISSADAWMLVGNSRPAGAGQTIRHHKGIVGGAWTHTDTSGTFGNPVSQAVGQVVFGQIDGADWFKGRLAVAAEFAAALSDGNFESLLTTFTRANWLALGASGLWDELDVFATDHTGGGASRTSIIGTTDDADDPAGWGDWAGATPATPATAGMFTPGLVPEAQF